jgi:hypothetical protein
MKRIRMALAAVALVLAASTAASIAAETKPQPKPGMHGMMGGGEPGMMMGPGQHGMMMGCPMMSAGGSPMMMGRGTMPALPPGNEKLQMQMHAEIMQKVGEIIAKYADKLPQR